MIETRAIVWGVQDVFRAADFWSAALHYKLKYEAAEDWAILIPIEGEGVQMSLKKVSSPRARRHHLDLFTDDMEAEVQRLIRLGAVRKAWRYEPGADYVVLEDPEGNPFCVVQR